MGVVAFDTSVVGVNTTAGFTTTLGGSWSHTSTGTNLGGLVYVSSREGSQTIASGDATCSWGGVSLPVAGFLSSGEAGWWVFKILGQASGAQTISTTVGNGINTGRATVAFSVSYSGVGGFGPVATAGPTTGTAFSQTVVGSCATEIISQAFGTYQQSSVTGYSQTQRQLAGTGDGFSQLVMGDAVGGSSVNFAATGNNGSGIWAGFAIRVMPTQFFAML